MATQKGPKFARDNENERLYHELLGHPGPLDPVVERFRENRPIPGFPPRPHLWPSWMDWPSQRDRRALMQPGVTQDQIQKYIEEKHKLAEAMAVRARQIDSWIEQHDPLRVRREATLAFKKKKEADPFYGIYWACLLDPRENNSAAFNSVITWTHTRAVTRDEGVVNVDKNGFTFRNRSFEIKATREAIALAIQEGRSRGWEKFKVSGKPEFAVEFEKIAREMGVAAEITVKHMLPGGIFYIPQRLTVMPPPPPPLTSLDRDVETPDQAGPSANGNQAALKVPELQNINSGNSPFSQRRGPGSPSIGENGPH